MTKAKLWWFEKDEDGVYIHVNDPKNKDSSGPLRQYGTGPHRKISHEVGFVTSASTVNMVNAKQLPQNRRTVESIMFRFSGPEDKNQILSRHQFEWNTTPFSKIFKLHNTASSFVAKFNELIQHSQGDEDEDEMDISDVENLTQDLSNHTDSQCDQPDVGKDNASTSHVPTKRLKLTTKVDYENKVQSCCLGHFQINTDQLKIGDQIRPIDRHFVETLKKELTAYADECYQPVCALLQETSASQFDSENVNNYQYLVLGGQHLVAASKELYEEDVHVTLFKDRWCVIYADLTEDEMMWLSHRHNITHSCHKPMSLKDKVAFCKSFKGTEWRKTCAQILNEKSKLDSNIILELASLKDDLALTLRSVLEKAEHGDLQGQKLDSSDRMCGKTDIKPIVFRHFILLDKEIKSDILKELEEDERDLKSFKKESKILHKLQLIKRAFLRETNMTSWNEAAERFPHHTTRNRLLAFLNCNLQHANRPASLVAFAKSACQQPECHTEGEAHAGEVAGGFVGLNGKAVGYILNIDTLKLDETIIKQKTESFTGFNLAILDFPEGWTMTDMQKFCVMLRLVNMELASTLEKYNLVCLCNLRNQRDIHQVLQAETFCQVEDAYYQKVPSTTSNKFTLSQDVGAMVCAYWSASGRVQENQLCKPRSNLFRLTEATKFEKDDEGKVINIHQKSLQLLQDVISLMCPPGGWVLDACSGTGTGVTACLMQSYNCIAVESDKQQCSWIERRLTATLFPLAEQDEE